MMQMTNGDIARSYRQAANKRQQIEILAELNACDPKKIRHILLQEGVDYLPEERKKRTLSPETGGSGGIPAKKPGNGKAKNGTYAETVDQLTARVDDIIKRVLEFETESLNLQIRDLEKRRDGIMDVLAGEFRA